MGAGLPLHEVATRTVHGAGSVRPPLRICKPWPGRLPSAPLPRAV
jgi:hypothetical protein